MTIVDQTILQYLQQKGYKYTQEQFEQEIAQSQQSIEEFILEGKLLTHHTASLPQQPPQKKANPIVQLQKLISYIDSSSLDIYKNEMNPIIYPLFVHCCLLDDGVFGEFQQLFQNNPELKQLQAKSSELIERYHNNKYTVTMSQLGWEMLFNYMIQEGLSLLVSLIMRYFDIQVTHTTQQEVVGHSADPRQKEINAQQVKTSILNILSDPKLSVQVNNESYKDVVLKKIKQELDNQSQLQSYLDTLKQDEQLLPEIVQTPKTNLDVEKELESFRDFKHRVNLSADLLPSIVTYTVHNSHDMLTCSSFSKDYKTLATGTSDSFVKLYSLTKDGLRSLKNQISPEDLENAVDTSTGYEESGPLSRKLIGHSGPVYGVEYLYDNRLISSCSQDGTLRLWSADTFTNLLCWRSTAPVWCCAASNQSPYIATGGSDKTVRLYSVERPHALRVMVGHLQDVDCVSFHPNDAYIMSSSGTQLRMWDLNSGQSVRVLTGSSFMNSGTQSLDGHSHLTTITSLAMSPNGLLCATGSADGCVVVWEIQSCKVLFKINADDEQSQVFSLDFSKDSNTLAAGYQNGSVKLWDLKKNAHLLSVCKTKRTPVQRVQFTPRNLLMTAGPFQPYEV